MSLSFDNIIKLGNINSIWIIRIYANSDGSTKTDSIQIGTSEYSNTDGYWYPIVKNNPSIRTKINLAKQDAKTSDITLNCMQDYKPNSVFSELLLGSTNYMNKPVKIWQKFTNTTSPSGVIIYTGRLVDVSHNRETCTLKVQSARAWDFISIPNKKSTTNNVFFPVVYGNYSAIDSTTASPQVLSSGDSLHPIPQDQYLGNQLKYLVHEDLATDGTDEDSRGHFFDKNMDIFIPFDPYDETPEGYGGGGAINVPEDLKKTWKTTDVSEGDGNDFSFFSNVTTTDYTTASISITNTSVNAMVYDHNYLNIDFKKPDGRITAMSYNFDWVYDELTASFDTSSNANRLVIADVTTGMSDFIVNYDIEGGDSSGSETHTFTTAELEAMGGTGQIKIKFTTQLQQSSTATRRVTATAKVRNFVLTITTEVDASKDAEASAKRLSDLEYVYCGADGLNKSYNGGSGYANTIPEAHRDLICRFTGLDDTDGNIAGWSDLNTARQYWKIKFWQLEQEPLIKVLERLQFEGGFIFTFTPSGSMKYIYIKSSYSGGDISYTFNDEDLSNINVAHTPFSELQTQYETSYQRHPALNRYKRSQTDKSGGSDTIRNKWNIQAKENISSIELDALYESGNGSNDIQEFVDYYFNIFGDLKIIITGNIVNPSKWGIEVGDVVSFADISMKAFSTDLGSGDYFMITEITRTLDSVKFKAREVG